MARPGKIFLGLLAIVLHASCGSPPQNLPFSNTAGAANARAVEQCSTVGNLMCGVVSMFSGETAVEGRSTCIAYVESGGRRVEQCQSSSSQYSKPISPAKAAEPKRTARLSWKDNSNNESGFRIYRITENQKTNIAELPPGTTSYTDNDPPPKACYVVVAFNSAGESSPTSKSCLPD